MLATYGAEYEDPPPVNPTPKKIRHAHESVKSETKVLENSPSGRRMPWGVCSECNDNGPLPPFGEGRCFLCATNHAPGGHVQSHGAAGFNTKNGIQTVSDDIDMRRDEYAPDDIRAWKEGTIEEEVGQIFDEEMHSRGHKLHASGWREEEQRKLFSKAIYIGPTKSSWKNLSGEIAEELNKFDVDAADERVFAMIKESLGEDSDGGALHGAFRQTLGEFYSHVNAYADEARANGICYAWPCSLPSEKCGLCAEHYRYQKARSRKSMRLHRATARGRGVCFSCPRESPRPADQSGMCAEHYAGMIARKKRDRSSSRAAGVRRGSEKRAASCNCRPPGGRPGPCLTSCKSKREQVRE